MSNLPRIPAAQPGVVEPGVGRTLTAWLRYDWMTTFKELFLEDQVRGIVPRTDTERVYAFTLHLPPFSYEEAPGVMRLTANMWDVDGELDPNESMTVQVARRMFHMAPHAFPGISPTNQFIASWAGGDSESQSFVTEFQGKKLRVTVQEVQ